MHCVKQFHFTRQQRGLKMLSAVLVLGVFCLIQTTVGIVVDTPSGKLLGGPSPLQPDVNRFLGVPFANPPVRFAKPEMVTPWTGIRNATEFGKACYQNEETVPGIVIEVSEDCLFVDIYVPTSVSNDGTPKAVMVWIYGGGFILGSSSQYEGSLLAKTGNVIVVAINYRLGAFGWIYADGKVPANLGLWDQKLALEWVQANIQAFGGDKDKVTVFGESAGSISISSLIMSPVINTTHFKRAIMQSGSFLMGDPSQFVRGLSWNTVLVGTGCWFHFTTAAQLNCLRSKPSAMLQKIGAAAMYLPTHDGVFLTESSQTLLKQYGEHGIDGVVKYLEDMGEYDIMTGYNGQEGYLMLAPITQIFKLNLEDGISKIGYDALSALVLLTMGKVSQLDYLQMNYADHLPGRTEEQDNMNNLLNMLGDFMMAMPVINTGSIHSNLNKTTKTYMYMFDHIPSMGSLLKCGPKWLQISASHGDDIFFTNQLNAPEGFVVLDVTEVKFRTALMTYWSNFAKDGDPNTKSNTERGGEVWHEYSTDDPQYMRFTADTDIPEKDPRCGKQRVWQHIYDAWFNPEEVNSTEILTGTPVDMVMQQIFVKGFKDFGEAITDIDHGKKPPPFGDEVNYNEEMFEVFSENVKHGRIAKEALLASSTSVCYHSTFVMASVMIAGQTAMFL